MEAGVVTKDKVEDLNQGFGLDSYRSSEIKQREAIVNSLVAVYEDNLQSYCHGTTCGCHGGNHQGRPPRS